MWGKEEMRSQDAIPSPLPNKFEVRYLLYSQTYGASTTRLPDQPVEVSRTVNNYVHYLRDLRDSLRQTYFTAYLDQAAAERFVEEVWRRFKTATDRCIRLKMYPNLNLKDWPFKTFLIPNSQRCGQGVRGPRSNSNGCCKKMQLVPKSSLASSLGKFRYGQDSHATTHPTSLSTTNSLLIPVYAVMPKRSTGFIELYREIILALPYDFLGDQLVKLGSSSGGGSVTFHRSFAGHMGL